MLFGCIAKLWNVTIISSIQHHSYNIIIRGIAITSPSSVMALLSTTSLSFSETSLSLSTTSLSLSTSKSASASTLKSTPSLTSDSSTPDNRILYIVKTMTDRRTDSKLIFVCCMFNAGKGNGGAASNGLNGRKNTEIWFIHGSIREGFVACFLVDSQKYTHIFLSLFSARKKMKLKLEF